MARSTVTNLFFAMSVIATISQWRDEADDDGVIDAEEMAQLFLLLSQMAFEATGLRVEIRVAEDESKRSDPSVDFEGTPV